ncbi:ABC transporter substrate-binding protein [Gracilibacillus alcaliphilus]|uniref:ABC transporter substrate-binding protein n=1 Tax=Gracilibacillus alcaliphilus TaxID=1401441 RepID=UPI001957EB83|nr:ABC transporter substrate-binding protein [Gracilibacillus alcaliphilus]MBM7675621.1 raffinose/stachyose/melibiose transport system substrate-binding protein [Gracilibacillus alcaliphilus]
MRGKKIVSLLICVLAFLAACGGNPSSNEEDTAEGSTVTILIDNGQNALAGAEAIAEGVKEKYNIDTDIEVRPGGSEGDNVVKTRLATGEMTDIMFYNSGALFQALNPSQHFLDLSEEDYMNSIQDTFKEVVSDDESIYGIPAEASQGGGILYNRAVYQELELEPPKTWEEFMENNEKIKATQITPVVAAYQDTHTSQIILLADYYNLQLEDPDFAEKYTANEKKFVDTPAAVRGLEKIAELYENGYYNSEASSTSHTNALEMLATGEAAHYPILTGSLTELEKNHPDTIDDIGFFGIPGDESEVHGMTLWLPSGFYLNKEAKDMEAAKQWMAYAASPEGVEKHMEAVKPNGPYMVDGVELPVDSFTAVEEMNEYVEAEKTAPALEFVSPLKGPNLEQITVELGLGMIGPAEAAEKYDRDVDRQAQQLDLEGW